MNVARMLARLVPPRSYPTLHLGRDGERRAALGYRIRGYRIVGRNVRFDDGEIDIVARRGNLVAVVEVKTRQSTAKGEPWEAVDAKKRKSSSRSRNATSRLATSMTSASGSTSSRSGGPAIGFGRDASRMPSARRSIDSVPGS